jgi:DNA-binding GntR family transcriptional regulator
MGASTDPVYLRVLEDLRARIRDGTLELSAGPARLAEAGALGIAAGATVMVVERVHLAGERAVEAAGIIIPAERFRLRYRFRSPA